MWIANLKKPTALIPSSWFSVLNIDCRRAMMKVTGSTVIDVTVPLSFFKFIVIFFFSVLRKVLWRRLLHCSQGMYCYFLTGHCQWFKINHCLMMYIYRYYCSLWAEKVSCSLCFIVFFIRQVLMIQTSLIGRYSTGLERMLL